MIFESKLKKDIYKIWTFFVLGQYTSFGECGNICRKDSVSCPNLREFCSVCRKLYGGECFNVRKKTYICNCEKGKIYSREYDRINVLHSMSNLL